MKQLLVPLLILLLVWTTSAQDTNAPIPDCTIEEITLIWDTLTTAETLSDFSDTMNDITTVSVETMLTTTVNAGQRRLDWWLDTAPLLPDCAFGQEVELLVGRTADNLLISSGLSLLSVVIPGSQGGTLITLATNGAEQMALQFETLPQIYETEGDALSNDPIPACDAEQIASLRTAIIENDIESGLGAVGQQIRSVTTTGEAINVVVAVGVLRDRWWREIVPELPRCDLVQQAVTVYGRTLNETLISVSLSILASGTQGDESMAMREQAAASLALLGELNEQRAPLREILGLTVNAESTAEPE